MGRKRQGVEALLSPWAAACALGVVAALCADMPWAAAQDPAQRREYEACMTRAIEEPVAGFERAAAWAALGGGDAARHCSAVALYHLGHYEEAALRLERLAESPTLRVPELRASIFGQAGNAWLSAGNAERAHSTLSVALGLLPNDPELLIDRSLALAAAQSYWLAIDDLHRALDADPDNASALTLRASAYRYLDQLELARDDADRALAIEPDNASALLERGNIRRLQGDSDGARADWLTLLRLEPEGPLAEAARRNLERLDLHAD